MVVCWVVAPCSLVKINWRFNGACFLHHQGTHRPDDGGSKHLWNVCKIVPYYTAQQPRRQLSSSSPPWEPEISVNKCLLYSEYIQYIPQNQFVKIKEKAFQHRGTHYISGETKFGHFRLQCNGLFPDSSVSFAMGYGLDDPGSIPGMDTAMGLNQPPIQCTGGSPTGIKRPERAGDHSPPS
jgi:hypothetical protein